MPVLTYTMLTVAIALEVVGTTFLQRSEQFTRLFPTLMTAICYGAAFYFLSLTLRTIPLGIAYAIWSGRLSALGVAVWSLGAIMAFVLIRYLRRTTAFWIVHDGVIRFERLSLIGMTESGEVGGDEVARIDVDSGGRRGSHYVLAIRLHSGKTIRSPVLVGKEQTRAVKAEIVRRLGLDPSDKG